MSGAIAVVLSDDRVDLFGPFEDDAKAWDWLGENFPMGGSEICVVRRLNTACELLGVKDPT